MKPSGGHQRVTRRSGMCPDVNVGVDVGRENSNSLICRPVRAGRELFPRALSYMISVV